MLEINGILKTIYEDECRKDGFDGSCKEIKLYTTLDSDVQNHVFRSQHSVFFFTVYQILFSFIHINCMQDIINFINFKKCLLYEEQIIKFSKTHPFLLQKFDFGSSIYINVSLFKKHHFPIYYL